MKHADTRLQAKQASAAAGTGSHDHPSHAGEGQGNPDAHHHHHHSTAGLTRNQKLVLEALDAAAAPLSAYRLLDLLRNDGFRAPLQVYRALDKLVEHGHVHRLESLNAFVACQHRGEGTEDEAAFAICGSCGKVEELQDSALTRDIRELSERSGFKLGHSVVELRGTCGECSKHAAA
jgi:Fur family transcriptional regulator, zinc uptake regulator